MEAKQRGRSQSDGRTKDASSANEKSTQAGEDTVGSAQVGSALSAAIENQQLMFDKNRLGNDGTKTARSRTPG